MILLEPEAKQLCSQYGIPVTNYRVAGTRLEALKAAGEIGYPVVLKIVSPDVIHKSDVGGVFLNLRSPEEVGEAYDSLLERVRCSMPNARIQGVLVEEMAPPSVEVVVGAIRDSQFGPTLMFGLGGLFVEILKDTSFRLAPITEVEAMDMIREVKAYTILEGYRSQPRADLNAIKDVLMKVSKLIVEHQEIRELDLNPVVVYEKGAKVVDARIILE